MRAVVQRVLRGQVSVAGEVVGSIGCGLVVLVGVAPLDTETEVRWLAEKLLGLRIFEDDEGKLNRSVSDVGGGLLVVSQFTLLGDCRHGRRPSFTEAARPEIARPLYESLVAELRGRGAVVATGQFQTEMQVELVNDGPVTLLLDSTKLF